jgi:hypothetical protein
VLVLDAIDDIAEVIAHVAKGFNGHGHNCGAPGRRCCKRDRLLSGPCTEIVSRGFRIFEVAECRMPADGLRSPISFEDSGHLPCPATAESSRRLRSP